MKYLLTFAVSVLMSFQVMAADLKSKDVTQWMTSMPILKPWLEQHESELTANISEPNNPEVVFKESVPALKKAGLYDELNGKVKKLGYDNVEQWTNATQQVTFAWMALEMEDNKTQIEEAKAQFEAMKVNPDIPAAQKAIMEQMMAPALVMVELANQSSDADKKAVKPHQGKLRTYFEAEQK
ncbi:MAG: hypothetical protein KBT75_04890 [Oleispira antarctica]|uniref:Uncharacterized protein n=1 Tax=Oleispira antarctica RB-8 TaxID=698738 RepID=R4YLE9_OLEAN|nr:hypothetical protein [Oleispira antarctica]MBQ0792455.1 hypothetical protein [Oleispira antarctica]CCK75350.1 conserved hypothetical protein [Oleispira antarctica RB-8]